MFKRAIHPGLILKDELDELEITPAEFARQIEASPERIHRIIAGDCAITADSALRFGHWFGVEPQFWLNLQSQFDLVAASAQIGAAIQNLPTKESLRQGAGAGLS